MLSEGTLTYFLKEHLLKKKKEEEKSSMAGQCICQYLNQWSLDLTGQNYCIHCMFFIFFSAFGFTSSCQLNVIRCKLNFLLKYKN